MTDEEFQRTVLALLRRALASALRNEAQGIDIIMDQASFKMALDAAVAGLTTLGQQLTDGEVRLEKALAEVLAAAQAAGNTTPEMDASLQALQDVVASLQGKGQAIADTAQKLDDVNPDPQPAP